MLSTFRPPTGPKYGSHPFKSGDWYCSSCSFHNFQKNTICKGRFAGSGMYCNANRPGLPQTSTRVAFGRVEKSTRGYGTGGLGLRESGVGGFAARGVREFANEDKTQLGEGTIKLDARAMLLTSGYKDSPEYGEENGAWDFAKRKLVESVAKEKRLQSALDDQSKVTSAYRCLLAQNKQCRLAGFVSFKEEEGAVVKKETKIVVVED